MGNGHVQNKARTGGGDKAGLGADDSGEMNIQVVVRCRSVSLRYIGDTY